jgi:hypothetical protein
VTARFIVSRRIYDAINGSGFWAERNMMKTRYGLGIMLVVLWAVPLWADLIANQTIPVYPAGTCPSIVIKGDAPVITFVRSAPDGHIGYTEDMGQHFLWLGSSQNNFGPNLALDGEGNIHVVWRHLNVDTSAWEIVYQKQTAGSFVDTIPEVVNDATHAPADIGKPEIAVNTRGVHVTWPTIPLTDYGYRRKGFGGWGDYMPLSQQVLPDSPKINLMGARWAVDDNNQYLFFLPRSSDAQPGLRYLDIPVPWSTIRTVAGNDVNLNIGWENNDCVSACWRGTKLDVAAIADNTNTTDTATGRVVLILDVLNNSSAQPIEVFNDGILGSVDATAGSVSMAIDFQGRHYVFFSARNGSDSDELFMQQLDIAGVKTGELARLTQNTVDDLRPDVEYQYGKLHLTWQTSDNRVMYREGQMDRRVFVNGQPFFPVGLYALCPTANELNMIGAAKFNCVMPYELWQKPLAEQSVYLTNAQRAGVKTIYPVNQIYEGPNWNGNLGSWTGEMEVLEGLVNTFKNNSNILAWYNCDELGLDMIPRMKSHYELMKQLDSKHPVWMVDYQVDSYSQYLGTFDACGQDWYPIAWDPIGSVAVKAETLLQQTGGGLPIWNVVQASNLQIYHPDQSWQRPPTLQEMRNMAYQNLAKGATGLIFFMFDDLKWDPDATFNSRWADMSQLGQEFSNMSPILLSTATPVSIQVSGNNVIWFSRAYNNVTYLYLVSTVSSGSQTTATASWVENLKVRIDGTLLGGRRKSVSVPLNYAGVVKVELSEI